MTSPPSINGTKPIVHINGVDVSSYMTSVTHTWLAGGISSLNVSMTLDVLNAVTAVTGNIIDLYKSVNGTYVRRFYGVIITNTTDTTGVMVTANDELWKSTGVLITKLYDTNLTTDMFGGDIRLILIDLVAQCGLSMDDANVDQTSTTIPQVLCNNTQGYQELDTLTQVLYWNLFQDPVTRKINARNSSLYPAYPTTLAVGAQVTDSPTYNSNIYQVINEVEIQGVVSYPSNVDSFTADGVKKIFQLANFPLATYIKVTDNGVVKSGAVAGSAGTYDYLVNQNAGTVTFAASPISGHTILCEYTTSQITNVTVSDSTSKATTQGTRKIVLSLPDVITVADALQRGQQIIAQSKNTFQNFTINAYNVDDLDVHNTLNFNDPLQGITFTNLYIIQVKSSWPTLIDEITVGQNPLIFNNLLMSVAENIKQLQVTSTPGIQLTVNKTISAPLVFLMDDFEVIEESVDTGQLTQLVKRRWLFNNPDELQTGTWSQNVNIYNGKIEFA